MNDPYAPQAHMSQLDEGRTRISVMIGAIAFIEFVWWAGGGTLFAAVYGGFLFPGGAAEATLSLFSTAVLWLAVAVALRLFQSRGWVEFIQPFPVAFADFLAVLRWSGALMLGLTLWTVLPFVDDAIHVQPLWRWLLILPFALAATFVQTTAEEVYFRGFLQSTLAARFKSPVAWAVLPSVAFGIIHIPNATTTPEILQIFFYTGLFGFFAADLTARSGTLGAAMGFHFVHNAVLFCIYGIEGGNEAALALWVFPVPQPYGGEAGPIFDPTMIIDTIFLCVDLTLIWIGARIAIRA